MCLQNKVSFDNLLIIAVTMNNSKRALPMYHSWAKYVKSHSSHDNVFLISNDGCPNTPLKCLKPSNWYKESKNKTNLIENVVQFRDVISKRLYSMEVMLSDEKFDWLLSVTDDVKINTHNLHRMMKWFNQKYNSKKDIVVKGHAIDLLPITFLQGGSGFIISRKAAEKILNMKYWILYESFLVDDMRFSEVWKRLGVRIREASSGFFIGHQFHNLMDELIERNYRLIPQCPLFNPQQSCGSKFHHLRDLTIFHTIWNHTQLELAAKSLFSHKIPSNLYWYQNVMFPVVCKMPFKRHLKYEFNKFIGIDDDI